MKTLDEKLEALAREAWYKAIFSTLDEGDGDKRAEIAAPIIVAAMRRAIREAVDGSGVELALHEAMTICRYDPQMSGERIFTGINASAAQRADKAARQSLAALRALTTDTP